MKEPNLNMQNDPDSTSKQRFSEFLLILTTIIWGTTFIITKMAISVIPPLFYMGERFLFASLVFLPVLKRFKGFNLEQLKISLVGGLIFFISNATQTIGMKFTSASNAGFITGLNVILVPVFLAIIFKQKVNKYLWIGVILSIIGIGFLSFRGFESLSLGDPLVLICAIMYAFYIIYIDRNLSKIDIYVFSMVQLLAISGYSFISSSIFENWGVIFSSGVSSIFTINNFLILLYMGAIASSSTIVFQIYGQRHVSPTRCAIIFSLEPVFAGFFAVIIGHEIINFYMIIGASLIFIGIMIAELGKNKSISRA